MLFFSHYRVCKIFNALARCSLFWTRVDVQFLRRHGSLSEVAMKFAELLPSSVTHLKLNFEHSDDWSLNLADFLVKLQKRCPNLQVLIFERAKLVATNENSSVLRLCEQFLANIRVLVIRNSRLKKRLKFDNKSKLSSKIEVLDASGCTLSSYDHLLSHRRLFRRLKKLYLADMVCYKIEENMTDPHLISTLELLNLERTRAASEIFQAISKYGRHLTELYLCYTLVKDDDITFNNKKNALSRLKKICLRGCKVTNTGIQSLIESCPSLQYVYVGNTVTRLFDDYSKCDSEKVQVTYGAKLCDHYAKVDYMHV